MRLLLAASLLLGTVSAAYAAETIPITPAGISNLRGVLDARIAPDAHAVAYEVATPGDPTAPAATRIWLAPTDGGAPFALPVGEDGDHDPRWSPDGHILAYLGKQGSAGSTRIWLIAAPFASAHPAADLPGDVSEFRFSPDGKQIAALVHTPGAAHTDRGAVEVDRHQAGARVFLVDVATGHAHAITPAQDVAFDVDWAPDGRHLVLRYGPAPTLDYFWYRSQLAVFDTDGRASSVQPEGVTALHPSFSLDGHSIVFGRFEHNGITQEVVRLDLATGHTALLGAHWTGSFRDLVWDHDGRHIEALGITGVTPVLAQIDAATGDVAPGPALLGDPYEFSRADNGTIAVVASTRTHPEEVTLVTAGHLRTLTDTNPQTAFWPLGDERVVTWRSHRDGTALQGILVLPPGATPGTKLPLVVQIHGGPYDAWTDGWLASWHNWARLLASRGYAVFMPNPRGSDGRGTAFATAVTRDWGGIDYDDINDGVASLEKQGVADPAREMIAGWSYGGFMSAWAAGHDTHWRTAIIGAGPEDLATMSLTTDVGHAFVTPYFGDPIRDRPIYEAHSPLSFAHVVHIPVLLLQGGADARVPAFQAELMYTALKDQGSDASLVRYPGAPHWFGGAVGADTEIDVQTRVLDWTETHLAK